MPRGVREDEHVAVVQRPKALFGRDVELVRSRAPRAHGCLWIWPTRKAHLQDQAKEHRRFDRGDGGGVDADVRFFDLGQWPGFLKRTTQWTLTASSVGGCLSMMNL